MRWLITGGCGFIGSSLIKSIIPHKNDTVRVVDNLSVGSCDDLADVCDYEKINVNSLGNIGAEYQFPRVELIVADILDEQLALDVVRGVDVIVHLAANTGVGPSVENPRADCVTNVMGAFNYLEAARINKVKRFIFASSGAPVGEQEPPLHEELAPHPASPYGASKLAGEGYCSAFSRTFGIETVVLRFGNVYGPGSGHKNSIVAKFIKQALRDEVWEIFGDGRQTRDFIYIKDLIAAIHASSKIPDVGGEIFQIATSLETTVGEITEILLRVMETAGLKKNEVRYLAPRQGDVLRNYSDTSKAMKKLGWRSKYKLEEGLLETLNWFLAKSRKGEVL